MTDEQPHYPADWYPDPTGRYPQRWWDGTQWSEYAANPDGEVVDDPLAVAGRPSEEGPIASPPAARAERPGAPLRSSAEVRQLLAFAHWLRAQARDCALAPDIRRKAARAAFDAVRDRLVAEELNAVPLMRLKEMTEGRVNLGPLDAAGFTTVGLALAAGAHRLQQVDGVGAKTASKVVGAARTLDQALRDTVRVRIDAVHRPSDHAQLLAALWDLEMATTAVADIEASLQPLESDLGRLIPAAAGAASRIKMAFSRRSTRQATRAAVEALNGRMTEAAQGGMAARVEDATRQLARPSPTAAELWSDYKRRAARYNGLLVEVGDQEPDLAASQGFLPEEIAARVRDHSLNTSLLKGISLRGYQAFGAKFALCQQRAMLGDEMGLGKTIEALAVMSHLGAEGATHFLVVCPASVLINWTHEARRHSHLDAYRLHGAEMRRNLVSWTRRGGIGVTTYQALQLIEPGDDVDLSLVVVDEAHYVKNPKALRTRAVSQLMRYTDRVIFMTGTPMENRVEEFRSLVGHLQPAVANAVRTVDGLAGATRFRQTVAPVYLRRNQSDVLEELPEKIETEEWVELAGEDLDAYREAVRDRNFMAMRRAAFAPGTLEGSAKLGRLWEIVDEAVANDRKVVVFSYFRNVLDTVSDVLGDLALGPLTGSVSPIERQALVDDFTARAEPAVMVSQIEAGGVGLNMQVASVVILTEPQWKPSIEAQAVARCHRMGQVRPVDFHRLLAEDSVDERMLEVLAQKRLLIDQYVASEVTRASADAVDVSDLEATKKTASQVEAERRIIEIERKRLGFDDGTIAG